MAKKLSPVMNLKDQIKKLSAIVTEQDELLAEKNAKILSLEKELNKRDG